MATRRLNTIKGPSKARLRALIEDATVDAYEDSEQRMGFSVMIEEHLDMPFGVPILGTDATVTSVTENDGGELVAVCRSGKAALRVSLMELPKPKVVPDGWEWIEAYREWARGRS